MARDRLIWMLETERGRLTEIIEALPVGRRHCRCQGRVILGNAMIKRLSGPVIQSMIAARVANGSPTIRMEIAGARRFPDPPGAALGRDHPARAGIPVSRLDGSETWFSVGSIPLRWENGQVQEALGIVLDIDAEKRLLEIQQQINARLEQRVREEMAAREAAQQRAAHAETDARPWPDRRRHRARLQQRAAGGVRRRGPDRTPPGRCRARAAQRAHGAGCRTGAARPSPAGCWRSPAAATCAPKTWMPLRC